MFERVVESVLEEYVSEWVEGLDSEKMKVALFAGKVEFRDLRMRGAALDKFQLPMKMKSGSVGKLSIKVPWKKLTSQAVKIKIEDVFLVVEPTEQDEARKNEEDDDSYLLRTRWAKQQEVRMLELLEKVKNDGNSSSASDYEGDPGAGDPDPTASWSYRKKILNTIMDNVSFEFTNIHIRYEDSKHLASSIPLALGLTIDSIVISTTNANGQEEFVDRAQARTAFVHRRLEMVQASVYGDHIESSKVKVGMGPMASGSNIIHPFSTRINLARNHDERSAATIPKLRCSAEISAIRACLNPEQSTFLIGIADFVSAHEMYLKRLHFQRKRPTVRVRSNARLWWQYALRGVMELHTSTANQKIITTTGASRSPSRKASVSTRRYDWKLFVTLWFARKEYIHLHKNMLRAAKKKKLAIESLMADRNRLNELEDNLEVPTIVFFRLCAARELELEGQGNDSPRKLSQWKSKWSSGRTSSGSSTSGASNGRDNFLEKLELYVGVNDRMHSSSEGRTSSFHEERNVEALLMALDLVVISFEVVLVEEYKDGDKSDTRDFLRFELNEFVVTVLQRTSSCTVSSRITSVQILDFRQTYEVKHLEKKEPQALLSMIDTITPNGQVATRKNPFVELNIESSENKFQLDCKFERFRYIHNLYATSKLRAYFIPRTEDVAAPARAKEKSPSPPKLTRKAAALPAQLLRKKSLENAFGAPEITKPRRSSSVRARAIPTREIAFSVILPEIDVFVHTTDASAEVEARLLGTHFQNGVAHNTFELSIQGAETYFLEPHTSASSDGKREGSNEFDAGGRKRSTLMQSTSLVFYGQKLVEGYLVPKWEMKCTSPPIQFSMSSKQYQQLLQASAEWQGPSHKNETMKSGKATLFVAEDERLNVGISIPQILIDFNGEGPIQEALSAASTELEELTGFELDIRDLNVMARFSSVAQAAAVDMSALSFVKRERPKLPEGAARSDPVTIGESEAVNSSIPTPLTTASDTVSAAYDPTTGNRICKLLELRGKTSIMVSSFEPLMGEVKIEQAALYWDHELLVALVRYHSKSLIGKQSKAVVRPDSADPALTPMTRFAFQVRVQRWFAFFMPKACRQEQISFTLRGTDLRLDISTFDTEYACVKLDSSGEIQLISTRLNRVKSENDIEGEGARIESRSEETHVLLRAQAPVTVTLESAGFGSLKHRCGAAAHYRIEGEEMQVNYLHSYWSLFLNHITKEIAGFSRWTDLLRMPAGLQTLNERLNLEMEIAHVSLLLPTCESEGKHKTPSDHIELDIRDISSSSRAYPDDTTLEQLGVQVRTLQVIAVMIEPKNPNQMTTDEETIKDEAPVRNFSLGQFSDVFIEHVAVPLVSSCKGVAKDDEGCEDSSLLDIMTVLEELEKMRSHIKVSLSSSSNWLNSAASTKKDNDAADGTSRLALNPYQIELLSRILDNNFASLPPPVCRNFNDADDLKVTDMAFVLGDLALDLLDPFDSPIDNSNGDRPSSGTTIARISLEQFKIALDGFASLRSQVRASSCKGALWKVDYSEDETPDDAASEVKSEVQTLCGSIFSSSMDDVTKQGIDIVVDQRVPSSDIAAHPKDVRIHLDACELLPEIVEFGQRIRYFASIESELSDKIDRADSSLNVSITTGIVYYLAAECVPNHVDEYGVEDEVSRRLYPHDATLKMIASGCIVGRYHSDDPDNSKTQVYGRNMSVKVSSEWPPDPAVLIAPVPTSPQSDSPTKNEEPGAIQPQTKYERIVCDDFTIDVELVTAEDAEATMAINLTHFHAVICTVDLFLFSQAKNVLGADDDVSDGSTKREETEEDGSSEEGEADADSKPVESQQRSLAPPEIEFREDSISMVQLLLEDTSITLLRQSGPHLSPIARLYTFRAMCKVTYEVGERIDGVVPTLTEVVVEFPDESLNEPNADDGVSIWGFNTALGSWEPMVEPWMFDLKGSLIRDETGEVTANLDFTGKEGHPLNVNMSPALIDSLCLTVKAYDGALHSAQVPYVSPSNVISSDCYLVNDTGASITYWVTHDIGNASRGFTYASRRKPKRELLSNRAKVALELSTSISPSLRAEQTVSFCWDDNEWHPLTDIPIRNTGKYIYGVRPRRFVGDGALDSNTQESVQPLDTEPSPIPRPQLLHILLDVSAASGCRTFTISSLVRLFNETNIAVDYGVLEADGKTITEIGTIEPKGACSVPFRFVQQIWSVRVFMKPHLYHSPAQLKNNSKLSAEPPSANRVHRWSNELFISERENSTLHTASCSLVLDDYACKCQKMFDGTVPFHPTEICKANGSFFHAHSRVFTSSNASSLQYAQLKLMSPLTLVNNCGVPIVAVLFTLKKVRRTAGACEEAHMVSSQVVPPRGRVDTLSCALHDETYCSISMTGSSWSRLFRIPSLLDSTEETTKTTTPTAALKAISSLPLKPRSDKNVVLSLLDFQSRTATLHVSFDSKETRERNAGHFMIVQPRFLLRNATSLPLIFSPQVKLIEKIPGTKSMMARFAKSPFSPSRKKQKDECCRSAEMEAIHAKLNALQDQKVSEDAIDEDELQAHYYSEVSAIMVQLEGNTLQSSSAQDISLEVGANTSLRVYNEATKRYHDVVALFKQVGGSRSMEVTFVERYLLLNQTHHVLLASAVSDIAAKKGAGDDKKVLAAPPRSSSEFSWWTHSSVPSDTCIRLKVQRPSGDDKQVEDYQWSGKFSLHDVSETALKVSTPDASRICVLRVQVRVEATVQVCVVVTSEDVAEFPLYRIINSCARETIWFKQIFDGVKKDASAFQRGVMQCVAPGESVCFGWDEAFFLGTPNREISVWYAPKDGTTSSDYHSSILLDQPGESQQVEIPSKDALPKAPSRVYVRWHLQGVTKTMVAQDVPLNRKERAGKQTRELVAAHGEMQRSTSPGFTSEVVAHFRLPHFGVSLVTSTPDELLLFSGQDVDIAYANINNDHDQCEVKIGCFQLDNQLSDAIYPVVIAPILKKGSGCAGFRDEAPSSSPDKLKSAEVRSAHGTDSSSGDEGENGVKIGSRAPVIRPHFFHLSILRLSYDANMDYIKYFSAMMQPARIQIDEAFLLALASFVTDCSATLERNYPPERRRLTSEASKVQATSDKRFKPNSERRIYIETLQLHPVKIQLSVTILNHYGETEESATGLASLVKLPLAVTKALLSSTFSQIDSATLYLNALHLNHAFASGAFLMSTVQQHYMLQGMRQIYSLIGAADILGNPVGLVTNLGVGVKDFFYEPAAGLVTSPQEFVLGLSRGTTSLFTHSLYGAFNAASKVTGTLSEGIATLSLDRKYLAERRAQGPRKQVATHIGTGLIHGTKQLGKGIFAGVTGVITAPAQGAMQGGLPGFIEGVGKGLIGVAVKPAAGVLDLAATTAAGITATTSALDRRTGLGKEVYRRREPRLLRVTSDQRVRVYTSADALVSRLLLTLPMKFKLQLPNELYDTHIFLPGARILVATSLRLLLLEFASGGTLATLTTAIMSSTSIPPPSVLWSHPLSKLVGAQRTPTGIAVHMGANAFDAELAGADAPGKAKDDVATSILSDLEELGAAGTDRVQAFLTDLVVRHQRATATSYGTE
ncbi:Vacuolar-sorting-associated 13 protein C-terminal [Phytophthora infestans]|uniref:Vacuolar-sorting-associated 13 protein C-terminal n=1 Tax=Phytophthora infestans TaxID=4787 RepID=A0A8S9TVM0_PHYIN|nr:Vacuolar-sorting-associated 13 protein C-terminal [Phytophthora infestans]